MRKTLGILVLTLPLLAEPRAVLRMKDGSTHELKRSEGRGHIVALPANVFGPVDLRVELEDASGNISTTTMHDAYSAGAKRRASRR